MKVLFDTNVYIEFFRRPRAPLSQVLIERFPATYVCAVVLGELELGATRERDRRALGTLVREFQRVRRTVEPNFASWRRAGAAARSLGARILNDALILCCAVQIGAAVWTRDKGLLSVAEALGISPERVVVVPDRFLAG